MTSPLKQWQSEAVGGHLQGEGEQQKSKQANKNSNSPNLRVSQIEVHTATATQFLAKMPKTYAGVKTASLTNGARKPGRRCQQTPVYDPI